MTICKISSNGTNACATEEVLLANRRDGNADVAKRAASLQAAVVNSIRA